MCVSVCAHEREHTLLLSTKSTGQSNFILPFSSVAVDRLAHAAINLTC